MNIQPLLANALTKEYTHTNENFMRFKFLEILNVKYVPYNNGRGHIEQVPQCDDNLISRINALVNKQTYFTQQNQQNSAANSQLRA